MYPSMLAAKSNAKNYLKGNFVSAVAVSLVFVSVVCLVFMLRALIESLFKIGDTSFALTVDILHPIKLLGLLTRSAVTLASFCTLIGPVYLGVFRWFWYLTADRVLPVGQVFYYYSKGIYKKTLGFILHFSLRVLVNSFLFFSPYILTVALSSPPLYRLFGGTVPIFMASLAHLTTLFSIVGAALVIWYLFRFFLIVPIYCNDDSITINEAVLLARHFSYYTASGYFSFLCSFLGWFSLCLFAAPIVYVLPFFFSANAMYCRFALNYGVGINQFQKK